MVPLLNDAEVSLEMGKKLYRVKKHLDKNIYENYVSKAKTADRSEKEILLTKFIKELQWFHEVQLVRLDYAKSASIKSGLLFIISFILFILPKFTNILLNVEEGTRNYYILTALLSGWMGGTFSILLGLRKRIDNSQLNQLKLTYRWDFIIVRAKVKK